MSYYFKIYWRLPIYGILLVAHLASDNGSLWTYLLWLLALSLSLLKASWFTGVTASNTSLASASISSLATASFSPKPNALAARRGLVGPIIALTEGLLLVIQLPLLNIATTTSVALGIALCLADYLWLSQTDAKYPRYLFTILIALPLISVDIIPTLLIILIAALAYALKDLEDRKSRAQVYYDQLRTSEQALKSAHAELEAYYSTLEEVVALRERNRISRDIHDNVGHALATTLIQLQALNLRLENLPDNSAAAEAAMLKTLSDFVRDALTRTRQVVHDMVPKQLTFEQLRHDLAELCHKTQALTGIQIILTTPAHSTTSAHVGAHATTNAAIKSTSLQGLSDDSHAHLYNLVKEALTNAIKHGEVQSIRVTLVTSQAGLQITISDDGRGAEAFKPAFGIQGIQERLHQLGGSLEIKTAPGSGFTLIARLPLEVATLPLEAATFHQEVLSHGSN